MEEEQKQDLEAIKEAIGTLREYCNETNCTECKIKKAVKCYRDTVDKPYRWNEEEV